MVLLRTECQPIKSFHFLSPRATAPVHLQRQHTGGRVLHADPVERAPHLLRQQRGGRYVLIWSTPHHSQGRALTRLTSTYPRWTGVDAVEMLLFF